MDQEAPQPTSKRSRYRKNSIIVAVALVILVSVLGLTNKSLVRQGLDFISGAEYYGSGSETVSFKVSKGDTGSVIARRLVALGVTKNIDSTLRHIYAANPTFFPGVYLLPKQISTDAAIAILTDPKQQLVNRVTVREGLRLNATFEVLSKGTGIPINSFEVEAENRQSFGLPKSAPSLEGYLYPATYDFSPGASAHDVITIMVNRTFEQLRNDAVAKKDWHKVLTLASIIQMEARKTEDFYKVSRTFQNRIAQGMHLQSDATVSYGVNGTTVSTSVADRNDRNKYNTYLYPGLPIGPIAGSGATAIDAAIHPADGKWLYFCAINLETGETVFSNTYAEHEKAVQLWRQWMLQNPGWNG
ncbi:MAG: endolytic transglycosylase MltG [Micrococcales bacterium]|nr:endolytic transglycosylase MltG [Micrococcales bacterium]NBR61560.1 endolytic transglycosylase MltG [Actinomycetota bacterium]NBR55022.1 endolytic transglycosylase MltG [Micrococcales bacterium]NBT48133.1 endolytic transglycosylase MltG [Actinomycetota bacterium]NBY44259.1 endolytic transglycosylase MltG [Micrococcales bacterium]